MRGALVLAALLAATTLPACDGGGPAGEAGPEDAAGANVFVPQQGCSGPDEYRILAWGETLRAVRPGCLRLPSGALASLRAACAETPTDPVWVQARRLAPGEENPCD